MSVLIYGSYGYSGSLIVRRAVERSIKFVLGGVRLLMRGARVARDAADVATAQVADSPQRAMAHNGPPLIARPRFTYSAMPPG